MYFDPRVVAQRYNTSTTETRLEIAFVVGGLTGVGGLRMEKDRRLWRLFVDGRRIEVLFSRPVDGSAPLNRLIGNVI